MEAEVVAGTEAVLCVERRVPMMVTEMEGVLVVKMEAEATAVVEKMATAGEGRTEVVGKEVAAVLEMAPELEARVVEMA